MQKCPADTQVHGRSSATRQVSARGDSAPLGATPWPGGVNFSLFSRHASSVELLFFDREDDARPARVIRLDPSTNRTYHYWHVFVPGARPGQIYGYRVDGPFEPARGMRFDSFKVVLDPYGRAVVVPRDYSREAARAEGDNAAAAMKSVVVDAHSYDWEGDVPLKTTVLKNNRLRDARAWVHPAPECRPAGADTGHIRRCC